MATKENKIIPLRRGIKKSGKTPLSALNNPTNQNQTDLVQLMASAFENMPQGVILVDKTGKVVMCNSRVETLVGGKIFETDNDFYLWDFWKGDAFAEEVYRAVEKGKPLAEDSKPHANYKVSFLPQYDENHHFSGATVYLTNGHELSPVNLPQTAGKPQAVGRIISAIAHEVNNPLQTIRTSLELSQDPKKNARRHNYLEAANHEISRIVQIISQMRRFYRPTPGQKQTTDLNATVNEALQLLSTSLDEAGIAPVVKLASNLPKMALLSYQLEQVFLYLLLQALEVLPVNRTLYVQTVKLEDGYVAISFSDKELTNLPNFHPQNGNEPVFDPFHSGKTGGLGLGLSISQEIIKELGGYLQSGENFSLIVYLPY